MDIWSQPDARVSKYFRVRELIYLPTWRRLATAADGLDERIWNELVRFANESMDVVRDLIGMKILIDCWYRPAAYNALPSIGGAKHSAHMVEGNWSAADWQPSDCPGSAGCAKIRALLVPELDRLGLMMEDRDGPWIHLQNRAPLPGKNRFFKP